MVESTLSILPPSDSSSGSSNSGTNNEEGRYTLEKRIDMDISNVYPALKKGAEAGGAVGSILLMFKRVRLAKWLTPTIVVAETLIEDRRLINEKMRITKAKYMEIVKERQDKKDKQLEAEKVRENMQAFADQQSDHTAVVRELTTKINHLAIELEELKRVKKIEDNSETLSGLKVSGHPTGRPGSFPDVPVTPLDTSSLPF